MADMGPQGYVVKNPRCTKISSAWGKTAAQQKTSQGVTIQVYELHIHLHFIWCKLAYNFRYG